MCEKTKKVGNAADVYLSGNWNSTVFCYFPSPQKKNFVCKNNSFKVISNIIVIRNFEQVDK